MIRPLRKLHLGIWLVMGTLLPLGLAMAVRLRPEAIRTSLEKPALIVAKQQNDSTALITIRAFRTLSSSCTLYVDSLLIGQIASNKSYSFQLPHQANETINLHFIDQVRQVELYAVKLDVEP